MISEGKAVDWFAQFKKRNLVTSPNKDILGKFCQSYTQVCNLIVKITLFFDIFYKSIQSFSQSRFEC